MISKELLRSKLDKKRKENKEEDKDFQPQVSAFNPNHNWLLVPKSDNFDVI